MKHIDNAERFAVQSLVVEAQSYEIRGQLSKAIDVLETLSIRVRKLRQRLRAVRRHEAKRGRLV